MYALILLAFLVGTSTSHITDEQGRTGCANLRSSYVSLCSTEMEAISELSSKIDSLSVLSKGVCDVIYNDRCFKFHFRSRDRMSWTDAKNHCEDFGWRMANIYSEEHYNKVMEYMRTQIPAAMDYTRYWSGMRFNPDTNAVTLSDGSDAPYVNWHSGYPVSGDRSNVVWQVRRSAGSVNENMWNADETGRVHAVYGVACEY